MSCFRKSSINARSDIISFCDGRGPSRIKEEMKTKRKQEEKKHMILNAIMLNAIMLGYYGILNSYVYYNHTIY